MPSAGSVKVCFGVVQPYRGGGYHGHYSLLRSRWVDFITDKDS